MSQLIVFGDNSIDGDTLRDRAARAASGLAALGVGSGDRVAVMMRNEPAYLEVILAADRLGAALVAINWHFRTDEATHILADSGARVLVVHADLLPGIAAAVPDGVAVIAVPTPPGILDAYGIAAVPPSPLGTPDWPGWRDAHPLWTAPAPPSLGMMLYTSGTTGRAKGVRRLPGTPEQHDSARRIRSLVGGARPGMRTAVVGPLYHAGPASSARVALAQAALIVVMPRFDAEALLRAIEQHRLTHLALVPVMLVRLLKLPQAVRARYDVSSLEGVTHGGSACAPEVKRGMIDWWGPILSETYGSTEVSLIAASRSEEWLRFPGTVGRALPGTSIRILDEEGRILPPGEVGEIHVDSGPNALPFTYHNLPRERAKVERNGHVTNGDVGYLNEEGFLFVTDRKRDMVVSGGVNIYPAEIEAALITHPDVLDCAVFGVPDPEYGEALVAAVQSRPGAAPAAQAIRDHLRERLAGYKVPRRIWLVDDMPRDSMGKVFKRRLREAYAGIPT
ncbi:Long-chain-fatty-acid--CoA ligase (plasmid) [Roseomonas mucosa]|uniref:Long-chain-fatty-acid--CoA ligase n=1 Tax=Roseomonas mucosa TaxID=207340 RepID=A0A4Y1MR89_9PROT|nr:AMP-binding protein [Roseomonas mucosa]AWV20501.1 Long-chain-fatty-acid--CoA ligase [Roseomonas mucosa]MDT8275724.1 AMP-binding protein [Roseomonas mucosa]MDT8356165.1 AMP-binding protein [Roseomonas mucosa]